MTSPFLRYLTKLALVNSLALIFGLLTINSISVAAPLVPAPPDPVSTLAAGTLQPSGSHESNLQLPSNTNNRQSQDRRLPEAGKADNPHAQREAVFTNRSGAGPLVGLTDLISGALSQDWGDYDRDGYLDLALGTSSGISIYHSISGVLTTSPVSFQGNTAYSVRWADLDGDGRLELVAVGGSSPAGAIANPIFDFDGTGFTQTGKFASDHQLVRVVVLSGTLDLIASTDAINAPCPVLRFKKNGQGQFAQDQCVSTSPTAGIGVGDFNNDGWPDLVLGRFPDSVMLLINSGGVNGVLTETNSSVFDTASSWPYDFAWADYDGDGRLDLAAAFPLQRQVRIYHNEALSATFKLASVIATQRFMTPLAVDWGDFNGDGALDLAVADDPPKVVFNVNQSIGSGSNALVMRQTPSHQTMWSARAVALDNSSLSLALSAQQAPGSLYQTVAGHLQPQLTPLTGAIAANSVAWGDADGNGQMDLLFGAYATGTPATLYQNVNGAISTNVLRTFDSRRGQLVAFGKFNRKSDGQLGVVIGATDNNLGRITVYTQTNGSAVSWSINSPVSALALGDFNNDGWLDLLVGTQDGSILLYYNDLGSLRSTPILTLQTADRNPVRSVAFADCNAQPPGNNDYLSFALATSSNVYVYRNNRDNTFARSLVASGGISNTAVAWGDFDGDSWPDLAVGADGQSIKIYNTGIAICSGVNSSPQPIWTSPDSSHTTSLASGDWNNDGRIDLAVGNDGEPNQVFANLGNTSDLQLSPVWSSSDVGGTTAVAWGDVNNDGYLDLAVSRRSGSSGVYYNTSVQPWGLPNPPSYLSIFRPGKTRGAYLYSSSDFIPGYFSNIEPPTLAPTVTIYYTAFNPVGTLITNTVFEYSLDGGIHWSPASSGITTLQAITQTAPQGRPGMFIWNAQQDKAFSDNAIFRIRAADQSPVGPWQRAAVVAVSPPFRARAMTCQWPTGLLIEYEPQTNLQPYTPVTFRAKLSDFSGLRIIYTWSFGDGITKTGSIVHHAYTNQSVYTVILIAESPDCPGPAVLTARATVSVQPQLKVYLPLIQRSSVGARYTGSKSDSPALADFQKPTIPFATTDSTSCLTITPSSNPTVPWITTTTGYIGQPALNSDGTRLAFWSTADLVKGANSDGNIELFYGKIDRGRSCIIVTQITNSTGGILAGFNLGPSINADGTKIAFFSDRDLVGSNTDYNFEIFLASVTPTGIEVTQVTTTTDRVNAFPSLNAAGNQIAFASDQDFSGNLSNADGNQEIFVATIGSGVTQVTDTGVGTFNDEPSIDSSGQHIAFVRGGNLSGGGIQEIYRATVDVPSEMRVTTSTADVMNYHPTIGGSDGNKIAFASGTVTRGVLKLATISGANSNVVSLTLTGPGAQAALNADDGSRVTLISNTAQVNVFTPGSVNPIPVFTCSGTKCRYPAISGDGMHVAFASNSTLYVAYYEAADLSITLDSDTTPAVAGVPVTFTFVVNNSGPSVADGAKVTGSLSANSGVTLTAVYTDGFNNACGRTDLSLDCQFASLPTGSDTSITVVVAVDPGKLGSFALTMMGTAWQKGSGTGNNVLTLSPNVVAESDLWVMKTAPATVIREYNLTADLAYTITITNLGPSHAQNVILTDAFPSGTTFVTQTQLIGGPPFILTNTSTQVIDRIDTLLAHQSATFYIGVNVSSTVDGGTLLNNTAVGTTDTSDPTPGNGNNISSVTTIVHLPSAIDSASSTTFTVTKAGLFMVTTTGYPTPTLGHSGTLPNNVTFVDNQDGTGTLSGMPITGTGKPYPITFTANNGAGVATQAFTLIVNEGPKVTTQPLSQAVCAGSSVNFTTGASGYPVPTVQWQRSVDGGGTWNDLPGETSTTLNFMVDVSQNGNQYRAVFTNVVGTATSTAATLTVNTAPVVTMQPTNQTVNAGQTVTFTAAASGTPVPLVQWQVSTNNGNTWDDVPGGTSTTLSFVTTRLNDGYQYRAVFSNNCNVATSNAAILTVRYSPIVTTHPVNQTVDAGQLVTFTAAASGNPTPSVQWQVFTSTTWNNIPGATSTTLSFSATASQHGYQYRAVFTNSQGTATSNAATLTVNFAPPTITLQPTNQTVNEGNPVTFTAAANGIPAPNAQWQVSTDGGTTWNDVPGATSATLSFSANASQHGYQYRVGFTNGVPPAATSAAATLTVFTAPVVTQQPTNQTVNAGQLVTFTAAASGRPTPSVQWQVFTGTTWSNIAGATSTTLSFSATASQHGYQYRALFTNVVGTATSNAATLTVNSAPPTITQQPTNQTVNAGNPVTFTAAASGIPTPNAQWQVSTNGGTTWNDMPGATSATLSFSANASQHGYQYRVGFTNGVPPAATSAAATLTVFTAPVVTQQPTNQTVNAGQLVTFTAAASGRPTPSVQWQVFTGTTWSNIPGATSTTLSFTTNASQNGYQYRALFSNVVGTATSNAATLTVYTAPVVTLHPVTQTVMVGQPVIFTVAASGNPTPSVQWQISIDGGGTWNNISGATLTTLSFIVQSSDNGNRYRAVFSNVVGTVTSNAATLTVN